MNLTLLIGSIERLPASDFRLPARKEHAGSLKPVVGSQALLVQFLALVAARGTGLPNTSIVPRWIYPPVPWPLPGIRSAKPTSSTLLRSGFSTHVPRVTTLEMSRVSQRIGAIGNSASRNTVEFEEAAPSA